MMPYLVDTYVLYYLNVLMHQEGKEEAEFNPRNTMTFHKILPDIPDDMNS